MPLRTLLLFVTFICLNSIASQPCIYLSSADASLQKKYQEGSSYYRSGAMQKAIKHFEQILKKHPNFIDANIQLASLYFDLEQYALSDSMFQRAVLLDSAYKPKVFYTMALAEYRMANYAQARSHLERYLVLDTSNVDLTAKARALLTHARFGEQAAEHPWKVEVHAIHALNSNYSEYVPSMTADGKKVFFTRRSPRGDEDLYTAEKLDSGWSVPKPLDEVNSLHNEGAPAISPDGNFLIFTSCDRPNGVGGCDLYRSAFDGQHWSEPVAFSEPVNSPAYESQACLALNGKRIYFVSNRKGTLGGFDIWYTQRKDNGGWSVPKNMGKPINTAGDEVCPSLHFNDQNFYFASDGHEGLGGKDLFSAKKDSADHWKDPINLGIPINSIGDESSWLMLPDGKTAWFASDQKYVQAANKHLKANLDLYALDLPEALRINPVTYLSVVVIDSFTRKPILANLKIYDLANERLLAHTPLDGNFPTGLSVPFAADYAMHVYADGYHFYTEHIDCRKTTDEMDPIRLQIALVPVHALVENAVRLNNIFFESASAVLLPQSQFELDALFSILNKQISKKVQIDAHTDSVGSEQDNQKLSEERAAAVIQYLVRKGIQASRFTARGFGETKPVQSNDTDAGRQANRRIEFSLID